MAAIDVSIAPTFDGKIVTVAKPGTLSKLLAGYDQTTITELTVIGSLNDYDIETLNALPNLAVLDMEDVNMEKLPASSFLRKKSLTSIVLPRTLKEIGDRAFYDCTGLTGNLTIPESVTTIGDNAFEGCSGFTGNLTIPESVTTIGNYAFYKCSGLTNVYCKATTPPQIVWPIFYIPSKMTLYVPTGCADAYRTAPEWSKMNFKEIIETNF